MPQKSILESERSNLSPGVIFQCVAFLIDSILQGKTPDAQQADRSPAGRPIVSPRERRAEVDRKRRRARGRESERNTFGGYFFNQLGIGFDG